MSGEKHQWRIEVLYDGHQRRIVEHDSADERSASETLGSLILYSNIASVIKVFKDNEQIRHIEVR